MMDVPIVDLHANYRRLKDEIDGRIQSVIDNTSFIGGDRLRRFERNFADYIGVSEAVGVASGTDAIFLALRALGVGKGDEVVTVANTFVSTVDGIVHNGGRPRFVDIDPDGYTMDVGRLEEAITEDTVAIMPVHLYGQPADMDPILEVASNHGLAVVEDCCQAHGAEYKGRRVGSLGNVSCFSFYPSKNLGALGDAGLVATDDPQLAADVRELREYGATVKNRHRRVGFNSRLDTLQATVLNAKLPHLDEWNKERREVAATYDEAFVDSPITPPAEFDESDHVYHLYVIRTESDKERDALKAHLADCGVSTGVHYPTPVHRQPSYQSLDWEFESLQETESITPRILSLPMYPELSEEQIATVVDAVDSFYR